MSHSTRITPLEGVQLQAAPCATEAPPAYPLVAPLLDDDVGASFHTPAEVGVAVRSAALDGLVGLYVDTVGVAWEIETVRVVLRRCPEFDEAAALADFDAIRGSIDGTEQTP